MSITVNTNMPSLIAQKSLYKSTNKMNTALQRLSTGLKINSAKDDAAGSAISTKLNYKTSSYNVAKDNAQMGQSMLDTANGTLGQINSMLQRIRDLSEQASNGTYGNDERKAMQEEINGLTEEIYRIKNTTEFNGKNLFGEYEEYVEPEEPKEMKGLSSVPTMSMSEVSEANWDLTKNQVIGISSAEELKKMADLINSGKDSANRTFALTADIDLNELGDIDGNGSNWIGIGVNYKYFKGTFDGNNYTISNLKINNADYKYFPGSLFYWTDGATIQNINLKDIDINGTYYLGGLSRGLENTTVSNCCISGKIKGSHDVGGLAHYIKHSNIKDVTVTVKMTTTNTPDTPSAGAICYTSKNGTTFDNVKYDSQLNHGVLPIKFIDDKYATKFPGIIDISASSTSGDMSVKTNLQVGISSDNNSTISVDTGFALGDFSVSVLEESDARKSLDKIDKLMATISQKMTDIGSTQNRLESIMEFQGIQINALTSANSLIKDADIAEESSSYIKNQILQNVTSSLLATANQNPQIALQLL